MVLEEVGVVNDGCKKHHPDLADAPGRRQQACGASRSGPGRKNLFRDDDLFGRTGESVFVFPRPAGDLNLDGVQGMVLHA
jgi:hypothetical protein